MTLLVVDPDGVKSSALADSLSKLGFSVSQIAGVADLPEHLAQERPELVLCPYPSGRAHALALAESILGVDPTLPVAVVTDAALDKRAVIEALRLGVIEIVEPDDLHAGLGQQLDRAIGRGGHVTLLAAPTATENAQARLQLREYQRDQRAGRYIQMGMLPPSPMAIDRYRLRHKLYPSLMLSGDFVDYFRITDRHFAFYMADVSGHGASSAFVTVLLKNFSRRLRREYRPSMLKAPGEILVALNRELLDNQLDKHVAIFLGVVDLVDDTIAYANGGHFPTAIVCDNTGCRFLESTGKPVGLFEGVTWTSSRDSLRSGPLTLAVVSDGVLEVLGSMPLPDKERRLLEAVQRTHSQGKELWQVLELEQREVAPDDIACLVITREA